MDRSKGSDNNYGMLSQFTLVLVYLKGHKYHVRKNCCPSKSYKLMTLAAAEIKGCGKCRKCFK